MCGRGKEPHFPHISSQIYISYLVHFISVCGCGKERAISLIFHITYIHHMYRISYYMYISNFILRIYFEFHLSFHQVHGAVTSHVCVAVEKSLNLLMCKAFKRRKDAWFSGFKCLGGNVKGVPRSKRGARGSHEPQVENLKSQCLSAFPTCNHFRAAF